MTAIRLLTLILIAGTISAWNSPAAHAADKTPVQVFILAGQSNMEGKAKVSLMDYQAAQPATGDLYEPYRTEDTWSVRDDVWIRFGDRKGRLTVGYGSPERIGPELGFGFTVGDSYDAPVLIIKTAWGGKSLYRDFRPPSSGLPSDAVLQQLLANARKRRPETTLDDVKESFGAYYRQMLDEVRDTLSRLDTHFPEYDGRGYELAGFVWFQGWNDMINDEYTGEYTANMANFIRDVRKDLEQPNLPFVIGQLGVGGIDEDNSKRDRFKQAQAAAAALPEFRGNVAVVKTDVFWDQTAYAVFKKGWREHLSEWEKVGSDYPFHYLGSPRTYLAIGKAFGEAMLALRGSF